MKNIYSCTHPASRSTSNISYFIFNMKQTVFADFEFTLRGFCVDMWKKKI